MAVAGVDRAELAALAGEQWGMLTTSQAAGIGVSKMALSRMAAAGELERVAHGVYAVPATADDEHLLERALWLALDPNVSAGERLREPHTSGVLSHESAARLLGIGDLAADDVTITVTTPRRTRRAGLLLRTDALTPDEVQLVDGLPVTRAARTIADLLTEGAYDLEHLSQMAAQAIERGLCEEGELRDALARSTAKAGGPEAIHALLTTADAELVGAAATRIVTSPAGQRALSKTLQDLLASPQVGEAMRRAVSTSIDPESMRAIQEALLQLVPKIDWPKIDLTALLDVPSLQSLRSPATKQLLDQMRMISPAELSVLDRKTKEALKRMNSV